MYSINLTLIWYLKISVVFNSVTIKPVKLYLKMFNLYGYSIILRDRLSIFFISKKKQKSILRYRYSFEMFMFFFIVDMLIFEIILRAKYFKVQGSVH